jgi:hypothetical protein
MQHSPSIRGGTWLGHDPPDNDGHKRIPAASSIFSLTLADAQGPAALEELGYFHTAEITGSCKAPSDMLKAALLHLARRCGWRVAKWSRFPSRRLPEVLKAIYLGIAGGV